MQDLTGGDLFGPGGSPLPEASGNAAPDANYNIVSRPALPACLVCI